MKDKDENIPHFFLGGIPTKRGKKTKYSRKNDKKQIYSTVEYYSCALRSLFPIRLSQLPEKFSFVSSVILSIASNVSLYYSKSSKLKQRQLTDLLENQC